MKLIDKAFEIANAKCGIKMGYFERKTMKEEIIAIYCPGHLIFGEVTDGGYGECPNTGLLDYDCRDCWNKEYIEK